MGHYDNLKEMLCKELKKFDRKQSVNDSDLETLQLLTDIIKNIDKIEILEEDGGYSQAGDWRWRAEALTPGRTATAGGIPGAGIPATATPGAGIFRNIWSA